MTGHSAFGCFVLGLALVYVLTPFAIAAALIVKVIA